MNVELMTACLSMVTSAVFGNEPMSEWRSSRSSFYSGWNVGACGFGAIATDSFPYGYVAAANTALYNDSNTCGHCFEVECVDDWDGSTPDCCKSGSVVVQASDHCDVEWCFGDVDNLVLSDLAFAVIVEPICGVIETRIRRVDCDFGSNAPLLWVNGLGINQWWYAVILENANGYGHVSNVEIREDGYDTWIAGDRRTYNAWVFDSPPNGNWHLPLDARVTGFGGERIIALELVTSFVESVEYEMSSNFALHSGGDSNETSTPLTTPQHSESGNGWNLWHIFIVAIGSFACLGFCALCSYKVVAVRSDKASVEEYPLDRGNVDADNVSVITGMELGKRLGAEKEPPVDKSTAGALVPGECDEERRELKDALCKVAKMKRDFDDEKFGQIDDKTTIGGPVPGGREDSEERRELKAALRKVAKMKRDYGDEKFGRVLASMRVVNGILEDDVFDQMDGVQPTRGEGVVQTRVLSLSELLVAAQPEGVQKADMDDTRF